VIVDTLVIVDVYLALVADYGLVTRMFNELCVLLYSSILRTSIYTARLGTFESQ
jgi:hypothetical protein